MPQRSDIYFIVPGWVKLWQLDRRLHGWLLIVHLYGDLGFFNLTLLDLLTPRLLHTLYHVLLI